MNPNPEDLDVCVEDLRSVCRDAWREGLLSGCNGNASRRLPAPGDGLLCVTRSGAAKGRLTARDCCLVDARTGEGLSSEALSGGPASSELGMHLELYRALPHCGAVLHSHPRRLLALSLVVADQEDFLRLPLFEADVWRARLGFAPALPPGGAELALAVADAGRAVGADKPAGAAVWMAGHGLCCWGPSLADALCMSEELEHLAAVQLLALHSSCA